MAPAKRAWISFIGLGLAGYGLVSALFFAGATWYSYYASGGAVALSYLNYRLGRASLLDEICERRTGFLKTYALYLLAGILIEALGRFLLHLWVYPAFDLGDEIVHVFLIGYPASFFFISETLVLIGPALPSRGLTLLIATLLNAFVQEYPNTFAWEWRYNIPYVSLEILRINVVVIAGWAILIVIPLIVKRILRSDYP